EELSAAQSFNSPLYVSFGSLESRGNVSPSSPSSRLFKPINSRNLSQDALFDENPSLCEQRPKPFFFLTEELSPRLCQSRYMRQKIGLCCASLHSVFLLFSVQVSMMRSLKLQGRPWSFSDRIMRNLSTHEKRERSCS